MALACSSFDWEDDRPPRTALNDSVIYEVHVKGLTIHPSSAVSHPGTYLGVAEKIPHFLELGVTAVELLPVHEFNEGEPIGIDPVTGNALHNYWGYSTLGFFAPEHLLRRRSAPGGAGGRVQADGQGAAPRRHRGDPGRGLQPHRRGGRARPDAELPRARQRRLLHAGRPPPLQELLRLRQHRQLQPPGGEAVHPRLPALLGRRDARRRLPLRPGHDPRPRPPGASGSAT